MSHVLSQFEADVLCAPLGEASGSLCPVPLGPRPRTFHFGDLALRLFTVTTAALSTERPSKSPNGSGGAGIRLTLGTVAETSAGSRAYLTARGTPALVPGRVLGAWRTWTVDRPEVPSTAGRTLRGAT